jgi:hypothetical protein
MLGDREARTMRVLLVLLVLLVLPGEVDARRRQRVLVVRDSTSAAWDGVVEQTVADFNAVMPQGGPQLRYERMDAQPCIIHPTRRRRSVLDVCSISHLSSAALAHQRQLVILLNDAYTGPWYDQFRATVACHEIMHILTRVDDNDGALPDQSCVWGELSQPGPFDIDLLRQRYGRKHR